MLRNKISKIAKLQAFFVTNGFSDTFHLFFLVGLLTAQFDEILYEGALIFSYFHKIFMKQSYNS